VQLNLGPRNIIIGVAIVAAGYFGYTAFFGDIETTDVGKLMQIYPASNSLKQGEIQRRILKLYSHDAHYAMLLDALRQEDPAIQTLSVAVLTEKKEEGALPQLLEMIRSPQTHASVQIQLARAFAIHQSTKAAGQACPRLIELTDAKEGQDVRVAAHNALVEILETGAIVKFSDTVRRSWEQMWQTHKRRAELKGP